MRISPQQNRILATLSPEELDRLTPHLELVYLPLNKVVHEPGEALSHAYFPLSAIVSQFHVTEDGGTAEIAVVGSEGFVDIALLLDGGRPMGRSVAHGNGFAYRVAGRDLRAQCLQSGRLRSAMAHYVQVLMAQITQTAVCNRFHVVEQRLCRRLLLSLDRASTNSFPMTQELMGNMLGVRRERITESANKLKKLGAIDYARGRITVLSRVNLEQLCCECYRTVGRETERLLLPPFETEHV